MPHKTPRAADLLGCTYHQLIGLVRFRNIIPSARDSSGDYVWTDADLDRARQALAKGRCPRLEVAAP
jgi:hypothetical protein